MKGLLTNVRIPSVIFNDMVSYSFLNGLVRCGLQGLRTVDVKLMV